MLNSNYSNALIFDKNWIINTIVGGIYIRPRYPSSQRCFTFEDIHYCSIRTWRNINIKSIWKLKYSPFSFTIFALKFQYNSFCPGSEKSLTIKPYCLRLKFLSIHLEKRYKMLLCFNINLSHYDLICIEEASNKITSQSCNSWYNDNIKNSHWLFTHSS